VDSESKGAFFAAETLHDGAAIGQVKMTGCPTVLKIGTNKTAEHPNFCPCLLGFLQVPVMPEGEHR
jgi:hypothetical protein